MDNESFRRLFLRTCFALVLGAIAVAVCYFWVDRPVAFFVHDRGISQFTIENVRIFEWLTYPPPWWQTAAPALILLVWLVQFGRPFRRWQLALIVACVSLIVADQFRTSLGDVCGRYWPETWFDNNPSLIGTGAYGFHPFQEKDDVGSFPSGHAARVLGFAVVWWLAYPRTRIAILAICPLLLGSLIAMNYHFVGDVIAGSVLGGIVAAYAVALGNIYREDSDKQKTMRTIHAI